MHGYPVCCQPHSGLPSCHNVAVEYFTPWTGKGKPNGVVVPRILRERRNHNHVLSTALQPAVKRNYTVQVVNVKRIDVVSTQRRIIPAQPDQILGKPQMVHPGCIDNCIYYWDRAKNVGNNNDSLYFTDQDRGTGGLSFALWKNDVCQFLINNALYCIAEFHVDGFRYDEISDLISMNCGVLVKLQQKVQPESAKPRLLQNAEYWPGEVGNYPKSSQSIVTPTANGGAGFDVVQHDGLRSALRGAVQAASFGQGASINSILMRSPATCIRRDSHMDGRQCLALRITTW
jgi:hypothetical protein